MLFRNVLKLRSGLGLVFFLGRMPGVSRENVRTLVGRGACLKGTQVGIRRWRGRTEEFECCGRG